MARKTDNPRTEETAPRRKVQRRLPAEARKRQIAEVAIDQIMENGVVATSAVQIAAAAGVSEAALYHHFGSRKQILAAALDEIYQELSREVLAPGDGNAVEQLRRIDQEHERATVAGQKRIFAALFQFYAAPPNGGMTVEVREHALSLNRALASVIERGKTEGLIRDDVDALSTAWKLTAIYWFRDVSSLLGLDISMVTQTARELLQSVLDGIATKGESRPA